jgi:hypothetical protein
MYHGAVSVLMKSVDWKLSLLLAFALASEKLTEAIQARMREATP